MQVIVATYEHKHGTDIRVFALGSNGAKQWSQEIAATEWEGTMEGDKPTDPAEMAADYWAKCSDMGSEFFNTEIYEVEG